MRICLCEGHRAESSAKETKEGPLQIVLPNETQ
jgi:hypothetical protein